MVMATTYTLGLPIWLKSGRVNPEKPSKLPSHRDIHQVFATQGQVGPEVSQDFIEQYGAEYRKQRCRELLHATRTDFFSQ